MEWKLFVFIFITVSVSVHFTVAMRLCDFEDMFQCNGECPKEDKGSNQAPGTTTPPDKTESPSTTQPTGTTKHPGTTKRPDTTQPPGTTQSSGTTIPACPRNMVYEYCTCQATCEDPNGEYGCRSNCLGNESCICPAGFLMNGSDCIRENECGCFMKEANLVIPNGELYVNSNCTQKCLCNNNQLNCETDSSCDTNATCATNKNGTRQCFCNEGYLGNGQNCTLCTDCKDVYDTGHTENGIYTILPSGWTGSPFNVSCQMDNGGGWTVFQRRIDGTTSFYQNWTTYKEGFGDPSGEFWLGNEKLHYLTKQRANKLRFDITDSNGGTDYAEYPEFEIVSEAEYYKLKYVGRRTSGNIGGFFYFIEGKYFSTFDRDNDQCSGFSCAEEHRSGWWHYDVWCSSCGSTLCTRFQYTDSCHTVCTYDNFNGDYNGGNGQNIFSYSTCNIKSVEMKIRPSS